MSMCVSSCSRHRWWIWWRWFCFYWTAGRRVHERELDLPVSGEAVEHVLDALLVDGQEVAVNQGLVVVAVVGHANAAAIGAVSA